jgi:lipopolysaccharide transport system ATP-binding protein
MTSAIEIDRLGKEFHIGRRRTADSNARQAIQRVLSGTVSRLRAVLSGRAADSLDERFWALKDITFQVPEGEVIGVIGRNGAGKSTLLKVLSRITRPTEGEVRLHGRVGSLLEVGTGFHPDLTGRDNIFLNGAILGMSRSEIRRQFDAIVAFAEVEQFIDTPVKHYSSGMYTRLAFAVAAHLEPEILIVDEVLAVGDAKFQQRCLDKMGDISSSGRTVLFVSHNMSAVQGLCKNVVWLEKGRLRSQGPADRIVPEFLSSSMGEGEHEYVTTGSHGLTIRRLVIRDGQGRATTTLPSGDDLMIDLHYEAQQPIRRPLFWIGLRSRYGTFAGANMSMLGDVPEILSGQGVVRCHFRDLRLVPQTYSLGIGCKMSDGSTPLFDTAETGLFHVSGTAKDIGFDGEYAERDLQLFPPVIVPHTWSVLPPTSPETAGDTP